MGERNEAMVYRPTWRERFWRKSGFRYHRGDDPAGHEKLTGWMRTDIRLQFDWSDRLRLLFTGKLFIASIIHTDTPSPNVTKSRVDYRIIPPNGDWL